MKRWMMVVLLIAGSICTGYAQNEGGSRYLNDSAFKAIGVWYDSTTAMFQQEHPIITSIPPVSTGMPYNILLSYVYTDSLLRFGYQQPVLNMVNSWTSLNDTLTGAVRYWYLMKDYNPILFKQYAGEVQLHKISSRPAGLNSNNTVSAGDSTQFHEKYVCNLNVLSGVVSEKFRHLVTPDSQKLALYSLLYADYILRIKIIDIDSTLNKKSVFGHQRYIVTAEVHDTIKGKVFSTSPPYALARKAESPSVLGHAFPLIYFQYTPMHYGMLNVSGQEQLYTESDPAFLINGQFGMQEGQEAVVFLTFRNQLFTDEYDYFDLDLEPRASLNALPIISGQVRDVNHVWSGTTLVPYATWKASVAALINKIITQSY